MAAACPAGMCVVGDRCTVLPGAGVVVARARGAGERYQRAFGASHVRLFPVARQVDSVSPNQCTKGGSSDDEQNQRPHRSDPRT
ncbi:hypothetical protein GCM10017668_00740 [Streptomyces tuirus]|uniref:Uncharacterized protein n=1 Tax=Streptomyces tuirus TaxID=68278 RepID=A0A7G1N692_9ACTN|nr:hypothetical protein GCM10017668_00740 [Streptomyces tuirus]